MKRSRNDQADKPRKREYRYVVKVVEKVVSETVVESRQRKSWAQLEQIAERRRVKGELTLCGVTDVESWCEEASRNGSAGEFIK